MYVCFFFFSLAFFSELQSTPQVDRNLFFSGRTMVKSLSLSVPGERLARNSRKGFPASKFTVHSGKRDLGVDNFRFVSLLVNFFFHVEPFSVSHPYVFYLLSCNIGLVVVGSALGSRMSENKFSYFPFLWKKVKVLIFPPYIFFFLLWCFTFVVPVLAFDKRFFFKHLVLDGYLWMIKGYVLLHAVSPFVKKLHQRTKSHLRWYLGVFLVSACVECFNWCVRHTLSDATFIGRAYQYQCGIFLQFPVVYAFFLRVPDLSYTQYWRLFLSLMLVILVSSWGLFFTGRSPHPGHYKYPFTLFYFSYGISAAMVSYRLIPLYKFIFSSLRMMNIVHFVSSHSLWAYLYHIVFIVLRPMGVPIIIRYFMLLVFSFSLAYFQSRVVRIAACHLQPSIGRSLVLMMG